MKIYYKGVFVENKNNTYDKFRTSYIKNDLVISRYTHEDFEIDTEDFNYIKNHLTHYRDTENSITDRDLENILSKSNIFYETKPEYETVFFEIIKDQNGFLYGKEILTGLIFPLLHKNYTIKYYYYIIKNNWRLKKEIVCDFENMARIGHPILCLDVASTNEIEESEKKNKTETSSYMNRVKYHFNENIFKYPIKIEEENTRPEMDTVSKTIENIEYLLEELKIKNIQLYEKYKSNFNSLYNAKAVIEPNCLESKLKDLNSNILIALDMAKYNCTDIISYLDIISEEYFNNMLSNNQNNSNINIAYLDLIVETILKNETDFTWQRKRSALKKSSLLYLLVVKNNIEYINEKQLEDSYFKDVLKTIIICISVLKDSNIIKIESDIDFNNDISVKYVLDLIKEMQFTNEKNQKMRKFIKI